MTPPNSYLKMFYLHREIPELLNLIPSELWLIVQRIMFETNRYNLLKSGVIRKALTDSFIVGNWPSRLLYLPRHTPDHRHYYLLRTVWPNHVMIWYARDGETTNLLADQFEIK